MRHFIKVEKLARPRRAETRNPWAACFLGINETKRYTFSNVPPYLSVQDIEFNITFRSLLTIIDNGFSAIPAVWRGPARKNSF